MFKVLGRFCAQKKILWLSSCVSAFCLGYLWSPSLAPILLDTWPLEHCRLLCDLGAFQQHIHSLNETQVAQHRKATGLIDSLLLLAYGMMLIGAIYRYQPHRYWGWLCILPLITMFLDFFENYHILLVLEAPAMASASTVKILSSLTLIKTVALSLSMAVAAIFFWRSRRRKRR